MVIPSRVIQSLAVPREWRVGLPVAACAQSGEEVTEAETRCQNSDVAISCSADLRRSSRRGDSVQQTSGVLTAVEEVGEASHIRTMEGSESCAQRSKDPL